MLLKDFLPSDNVAEFVQHYRVVHFEFDLSADLPFKAYAPRPEQVLVFYPYDRETVTYAHSGKTIENLPVVLYGQQLEVTHRHIGRKFLVFQIIFKPGALYRLTGLQASELVNEYLDATLIFGNELRVVNEQLAACKQYSEMVLVANTFVLGLMRRTKKAFHCIDDTSLQLITQNGTISIEKLAAQSFLSLKQFERKFIDRNGVPAKTLARIARFDRAFRLKNLHPEYSWLRIAMACHYHDYQHLAKDYKSFTGLSPTAFHALDLTAPERRFGLAETYYNTAT